MISDIVTTTFDQVGEELAKLITPGKVQSFVVYVDSSKDYVEIREEEVD
jgi:hypothetical protein